jgi:hypothetical protein
VHFSIVHFSISESLEIESPSLVRQLVPNQIFLFVFTQIMLIVQIGNLCVLLRMYTYNRHAACSNYEYFPLDINDIYFLGNAFF